MPPIIVGILHLLFSFSFDPDEDRTDGNWVYGRLTISNGGDLR